RGWELGAGGMSTFSSTFPVDGRTRRGHNRGVVVGVGVLRLGSRGLGRAYVQGGLPLLLLFLLTPQLHYLLPQVLNEGLEGLDSFHVIWSKSMASSIYSNVSYQYLVVWI